MPPNRESKIVFEFRGEPPGPIVSIHTVVNFLRPGATPPKEPKVETRKKLVDDPLFAPFRDAMAAAANQIIQHNFDSGLLGVDSDQDHPINDFRKLAVQLYTERGQQTAFELYREAKEAVFAMGAVRDWGTIERDKLAEGLRDNIQDALNNGGLYAKTP